MVNTIDLIITLISKSITQTHCAFIWVNITSTHPPATHLYLLNVDGGLLVVPQLVLGQLVGWTGHTGITLSELHLAYLRVVVYLVPVQQKSEIATWIIFR